jgi:hypothetical protein
MTLFLVCCLSLVSIHCLGSNLAFARFACAVHGMRWMMGWYGLAQVGEHMNGPGNAHRHEIYYVHA